jgi:hypothetical protein
MIKTALLAAAAALIATTAFADSTTTSGSQSQAGAYSGVSIKNGNGHKQAPSAIAPGLIASGLSCSGSAALGGSGAGWGLSLGITKEDRSCNAREDAKYIHGVTGSQQAAKERLCDEPKIREAFARAGQPCAADSGRVYAAAPARKSSGVFGFASTTSNGYAKPVRSRGIVSQRSQ